MLRKVLAVFAVVRVYNLFQLGVSMYLSAFFFFKTGQYSGSILEEEKLHLIVLISFFTIAAGYIINDFYDREKDLISKKTIQIKIQSAVSQKTQLYLYLALNTFALITAALVSKRVLLYFFFYQFVLWLYSHKLNRWLFINNITYALLTIAPFLALVIFYNSWQLNIYLFSILFFLFLIVLDVVKDLITIKADHVLDYESIATRFGKSGAGAYILLLQFFIFIVLSLLWYFVDSSVLKIYIIICGISILFLSMVLLSARSQATFSLLKLFYRLLIFFGAFFIAWSEIA